MERPGVPPRWSGGGPNVILMGCALRWAARRRGRRAILAMMLAALTAARVGGASYPGQPGLRPCLIESDGLRVEGLAGGVDGSVYGHADHGRDVRGRHGAGREAKYVRLRRTLTATSAEDGDGKGARWKNGAFCDGCWPTDGRRGVGSCRGWPSWRAADRVVPVVQMQLHHSCEPSLRTGLRGLDAVSVLGDIACRQSCGGGQPTGRPPGTAVMHVHHTPESPPTARLGCMELVAVCPRGRPRGRGRPYLDVPARRDFARAWRTADCDERQRRRGALAARAGGAEPVHGDAIDARDDGGQLRSTGNFRHGGRGGGAARPRRRCCDGPGPPDCDAAVPDIGWIPEFRRVGEAANPGPREEVDERTPWPRLRRVAWRGPAAVSYPRPGRSGFHDYTAPGHDGGKRAEAEGEFELEIETANTTGWASLKRRLKATDAHVLLAQETWIPPSRMAEASAWARKRGWKSIWAPAGTGPGGGPSGGVAIFAKDFLGLRLPDKGGHIWREARAVAGVLEAPGFRPMVLASVYLISGAGTSKDNMEVLADVGRGLRAQGDGWMAVMGGDYNLTPQAITDVGFDRQIEASVFFPPTARGTFRTAASSSLIDFFLVSDQLAAAVKSVRTVEGTTMKSHVPVRLQFRPRVTALRALHVRKPPPIEFDRVFGPLPPPPCWKGAAAAAEAALDAARRGSEGAEDLLEEAYRRWVEAAEDELEDFAGTQIKKKGLRGLPPNLVWRSVVPERSPARSYPRDAVITWQRGVAMELQRVGAHVRAGMARRGAAAEEAESGSAAAICGDDPDDDDDAGSDDDAGGESGGGGTATRGNGAASGLARDLTTIDGCCAVLDEIIESLGTHLPEEEPPEEVAEFHAALETLARKAREALSTEGARRQSRGANGGASSGRQGTSGWRDVDDDRINECQARLTEVRGRLEAAMKEAEARRDAEEMKGWRDWVHEGIEAGAARAHAFCRAPEAWVPTTAEPSQGGAMSCSPEALLEAQREKHKRLWRPADGPFRYVWGPMDELPALTPAELRDSSKTFKRSTATTYDGIHPRQVSHLCDEGLAALATLLQAVEVGGAWPRQVSLVMTPLLPKAKGGFRPIGLMPAIYRVWAKSRRRWTDEWEAAHTRPYLSAAKGSGPIDTMWRLAARQEEGAASGLQAAVLGEDIQAFFESIDREQLAEEAKALGFPLPVLRAALSAYAMARMLTIQGRVAREMHPTRGVVAGCPLAMTLVKVYYLRALDKFTADAPRGIHLDAYVDDLTLSVVGEARRITIDITIAHEMLTKVVTEMLGCSFAQGKTAIVATSRETAAAIARCIGMPAADARAQCLLGVDCTAGGARKIIARGSKKAARLRAAMARRNRLRRLRATVGRKANKVFRVGMLPSAAYDSPIWGIDDLEALRLRRLAAAAMMPKARGRSLDMVHIWHGLPTADAEVAAVVQYARMVWAAIVDRRRAEERGASIKDIRRTWEAAAVQFEPVVGRYEAGRTQGGNVPRRTSRAAWESIRGPVGAAALTLARVGWRFDGPFKIHDGAGTEVVLTKSSPAMIRGIMRDATRRLYERRAAARLAKAHPEFNGRRACLDLAIRAAASRRRLAPRQAGAFRALACGALMTQDRARKLGYSSDGMCPLCGAEKDTPNHRVYGCSKTEDAVRKAVPRWFWLESQRAAVLGPFWTTAIVPHPADVAPPPHDLLHMQVDVDRHLEEEDDDARKAARDNGCGGPDGEDPRDPHQRAQMGGWCYFDGSCRPSPYRDMSRAGCSAIEVNAAGAMIRSLEAVVPRHLPQTAQSAEFLGMTLGFEYVRRTARFIGDCLGTVRAMAARPGRAIAAGARYAGLVLDTHRVPERRKLVEEIRWTRAHRAMTGGEGPDERRDIVANAKADELAKSAVGLHPSFGEELEAEMDFHAKRAPHVAAAVAAALELFPPAPRTGGRPPRATNEAQARAREQHLWKYRAGTWRCEVCRDWLNSATLPAYRRRQACRGGRIDDGASQLATRGHRLCRAESELPFVICLACGAWGNRRTRLLAEQCRGMPTAAGAQAIKRLGRGWHPMLRKDPQGRDLPRDRAVVTHQYCPDRGRWLALEPEIGEALGTEGEQRQEADEGPEEACTELRDRDADMGAAEDAWDQERDVFGHGGDLDQDGTGPRDAADREGEASSELAECQMEGPGVAVADATTHAPNADIADAVGTASPPPAGSRRDANRKRTSQAIDFASRAIRGMMEQVTPRRVDAAGRMAELRKRIRLKEGIEADGAASTAPSGPAGDSEPYSVGAAAGLANVSTAAHDGDDGTCGEPRGSAASDHGDAAGWRRYCTREPTRPISRPDQSDRLGGRDAPRCRTASACAEDHSEGYGSRRALLEALGCGRRPERSCDGRPERGGHDRGLRGRPKVPRGRGYDEQDHSGDDHHQRKHRRHDGPCGSGRCDVGHGAMDGIGAEVPPSGESADDRAPAVGRDHRGYGGDGRGERPWGEVPREEEGPRHRDQQRCLGPERNCGDRGPPPRRGHSHGSSGPADGTCGGASGRYDSSRDPPVALASGFECGSVRCFQVLASNGHGRGGGRGPSPPPPPTRLASAETDVRLPRRGVKRPPTRSASPSHGRRGPTHDRRHGMDTGAAAASLGDDIGQGHEAGRGRLQQRHLQGQQQFGPGEWGSAVSDQNRRNGIGPLASDAHVGAAAADAEAQNSSGENGTACRLTDPRRQGLGRVHAQADLGGGSSGTPLGRRDAPPVCSAAAATGTAASDYGPAATAARAVGNVRRRIVGKQCSVPCVDDAPPAARCGGPRAVLPAARSARSRESEEPRPRWDAAGGRPPGRGA